MKSGITDPLEYITFPYLVTDITVLESRLSLAKAIAVFSIKALLMPMALIG
jgi:hypothetical protein